MTHMRLWASAAIIAAVILVSFVLSVPRASEVAPIAGTTSSGVSVPPVTIKDVFKKGTHTFTGTVTAPNACSSATATATVLTDASSTTGIRVDISLAVDQGTCLQVSTDVAFSADLAVPAGLPLVVTVNGAIASTTVL